VIPNIKYLAAFVFAGGGLLAATPCAGQTPDTSEVKVIVAGALNARFSLNSSGALLGVGPGDVALNLLERIDGIQLWRAQAWTLSHAPPFLVAYHSGALWRLGGFEAPDIMALSHGMEAPTDGVPGLVRRAQTFAYLLDQNGADTLVWQAGVEGGGPTRRSPQTGQEEWPTDTIYESDDVVLIRMTVFSRASYVPGQPWQRLGYSFLFARNGTLVGWSRRRGGYFSQDSVPNL